MTILCRRTTCFKGLIQDVLEGEDEKPISVQETVDGFDRTNDFLHIIIPVIINSLV
jgi:hypothetical protein